MRIPAFRLVRYCVAYLLGAFLIGWGLWCFGYEITYPAEVAREAVALFAPNMFCGVIICWGVILVLTTYHHYGGGIWTYLGAALIGLSMIFAAMTIESYLTRDASLEALFICLAIAAFVLLLGCYSLVAGQIRHRREQRESPPNQVCSSAVN